MLPQLTALCWNIQFPGILRAGQNSLFGTEARGRGLAAGRRGSFLTLHHHLDLELLPGGGGGARLGLDSGAPRGWEGAGRAGRAETAHPGGKTQTWSVKQFLFLFAR